ncbi:MAG: glutaredoxin family protein [Chromatiales bacterium]
MCHLCDDRVKALRRLQRDHQFKLDVVDVDSAP